MKTTFPICLLIFILSSCAFHSGMVSTDLAPENVFYEEVAVGHSKTTQVFGIGGLKRDALVLDAKKNMYQNFPLDSGERYLNMTVDFKTTYVLMVRKLQCQVSADIISARKEKAMYSENYFEAITPKVINDSLFMVGDTLYASDSTRYKILKFKTEDNAYLANLDNPNDSTYTSKPVEFTTLLSQFKGYELDEVLRFRGNTYIVKRFKWKRAVLLNTLDGQTYYVSYKNLNKGAARNIKG